MKNYILFILILAIGVYACGFPLAWATTAFIPSQNQAELFSTLEIAENTNENEVLGYLSNNSAAIRQAACMRLGIIGTVASLERLNALVSFDTDAQVQDEAAYAYWRIKYKQARAQGTAEDLLISLLDLKVEEATRTAKVIGWAMDTLGDLGSQNALTALNLIKGTTEYGPHLAFYKVKAAENIAKIEFISGFPEGTTLSAKVEAGLTDTQLVIREWAVRQLVKLNPPNLEERLNILLNTAQNNNDYQFVSFIARYLEELKQGPAIAIDYPQEGAIIKSAAITVSGSSYGVPFSENIILTPGVNTYSKTVFDREGNEITGTVTFTHANAKPVFNAVSLPDVIAQGVDLKFTVSAADADDAQLYYFASGLPQGAVFDENTQEFSWTPAVAGNYTVKFIAFDPYDASDTKDMSIVVQAENDTALPVTVSNIIPRGWTNQPVTVTLTATDIGSGVKETVYSIDGREPDIKYTAPFTLNDSGAYTIKYYSLDNAGNREQTKTDPNQVKIDLTAPVTAIAGIPNGWRSKPVAITLSATDGESGVAETLYSINNAQPYIKYTRPVIFSKKGTFTLKYLSKDYAGNREATKSSVIEVKIDKTVPKAPAKKSFSYSNGRLNAQWKPCKAPPSGIVEYQYSISRNKGAANIIKWTSTDKSTRVNLVKPPLAPRTTYYFNIRAKTGSGVYSRTTSIKFTTPKK